MQMGTWVESHAAKSPQRKGFRGSRSISSLQNLLTLRGMAVYKIIAFQGVE